MIWILLSLSKKAKKQVIHALNLTHDSSIHYIEVVDLENIVLSEDNIFFIETNNRLAEFHARVLCAFESAAIHNPLKKVWFAYRVTAKDLNLIACSRKLIGLSFMLLYGHLFLCTVLSDSP